MSTLIWLSLILIGGAMLLNAVRIVRGPSDFDRLLAAETLALGMVGLLMLRAGEADDAFYIDAALGLALFSFAGTVIFAKFLESRSDDE